MYLSGVIERLTELALVTAVQNFFNFAINRPRSDDFRWSADFNILRHPSGSATLIYIVRRARAIIEHFFQKIGKLRQLSGLDCWRAHEKASGCNGN